MSAALLIILGIETAALIALGIYFIGQGGWRFGISQWLLAAVNVLIYSGEVQ